MTAESFRFNLFFLTATLAVFATGLVMLVEFHVGHGARARAFAGVPVELKVLLESLGFTHSVPF